VPRILTALLTLTALTLAALTVACGSDASTKDVSGTPCTNDATREAVRSENATTASFRSVDTELRCILRRALLTPDDAPDGWTCMECDTTDYPPEIPATDCGIAYPDVINGVRATYLDDDARVIGHVLYAVEDGAGERIFAALHHSCGLLEQEDDSLQKVEVIDDFPRFGDDSVATLFQLDERSVTTKTLQARYGNVISVIVTSEDSPVPLEDLARLVDKRIKALPDIPRAESQDLTPPCGITPTPEADPRTSIIETALIELEDVGAGLVEDAPSFCLPKRRATTCPAAPTPSAEVTRTFRRGQGFTLNEHLALFEVGKAEQALAFFAGDGSAIDTCTQTFDDDTTYTVTAMRIASDPFGPDVIAWRSSYTEESTLGRGDNYGAIATAFRVGDTVAIVTQYTASLPEDEMAEPLSDTDIERLTPIIEAARRKAEAIQPRLD
jgi:hypothetical protein